MTDADRERARVIAGPLLPQRFEQLGLGLGRERRDRGTRKVSSNDPTFQLHAFDVIERLAQPGTSFTADDVAVRLEIKPRHPNSIGAAFLSARRAGVIEVVGYTQAKRANQHATMLRVYRGVRGPRDLE